MKQAIVLLFLALTAGKMLVAARLDLFGDEAFYWQCGQRPALAYVDHPPLTAMAVRLGTEIAGDSTLGVRLVFLVLGAVFPLTVYLLARPLVGRRDAWIGAGASLCVPALAQLGLLAVPDAILLPLTAIFLIGFERATRQDPEVPHSGPWLLAGLAGAAGLLTHYRFILVPAAAAAYLLMIRRQREHWRRPGPWLMFGVLSTGLMPSISYNLRNDFAPIRYYLAGRHGGRFDGEALLEHLAAQALLVTPLLYTALIMVLVTTCRKTFAGDDRAGLATTFALAYLGFFFLASPFEDSGLLVTHWPVPGYVPLLPYLPATLRGLASRGAAWRGTVALAPALGVLAIGLVLVELGTGKLRLGSVREPFIGWAEVAEQSRKEIQRLRPASSGQRLVVADNYKLGAQLEFAFHDDIDIYALDHHKNRAHGRAPQFDIWGIGEPAIRNRRGEEALLVIEVSQILTGQHDAWLAHASSFFEDLELVGELKLPSTSKRKKFKFFRFYRGRLLSNKPSLRQGADHASPL